MEGNSSGLVVGSGMAAVTALTMGVCSSGDHILVEINCMGDLRLMNEDLPRFGIETSFADPTDVGAIRKAIRPNTKLILVETVSNPTLRSQI